MPFAAGTRFGPYEITDELGVGGMGEVYRARDTALEREVALKTLPEKLASDADRVARFEQEAKTLASLNHPNIAQIHGLEQADGTTAIVMELVEGPTLADRIAEGPIPTDEALHIAYQIADALEAAHERQIVHRDLKPANVKLRPDGTVKVLDFGIAKVLDTRVGISGPQAPSLTTPAMTQAGILLGTAAYMSPEQARGKAVDRRSDIWAFGCVLYEMLTGQPAFGGQDVTITLARVLERELNLDAIPATISPALRHTISLCLQKDPRKRLHSMGDVRLALEGGFEGEAWAAARAPDAKRPAWRRHISTVSAALAAGLLVGVVLQFVREPETPAMIRFDLDLPQGQTFRNMGRDVIAVSPDGKYLAYNIIEGLYVRSMEETGPRLVPGTEAVVTNPFFSPDGEWIGYYDGADGQLKKIRNTGGASASLTAASNPQGASWGSDDSIVFGQPGGIVRVSGNGGAPELLIEAVGDEVLWDPRVLPNGSILFTAITGAAGIICVQTPGVADRTELFAGESAVYLPTGHIVFTVPFSLTTSGTLFVRSFDADTRVYGGPVPIEDGVLFAQGKSHFAISQSGTLVFAGGTAVDVAKTVLALADRNGNVQPLQLQPDQYRGPRVSPDGTQVAVEIIGDNARSSIWIYDLSGARAFRSLLGAGSNRRPIWTPDGKRLTFASDRDGTWGIYWQAADGSKVAERLTIAEKGVEHWPDAWLPDMRTLAFTKITGSLASISDQTIWTVTVDEDGQPAQPEALVTSRAGGVAFSPDGAWFAYRSTDPAVGTTNQIHVQPFPPTGEVHAVTDEGGSYPMWSSDGRELLYRRPAAAGGVSLTLARLQVQTGGSFAWGNETILQIPGAVSFFGFRDYDLMPDGDRFVTAVTTDALETSERDGPSIHVAVNWLESVKDRVR